MYLNISIHVCAHVHIHIIYIYIHAHTQTHVCVRANLCTCMCVSICICAYMYISVYKEQQPTRLVKRKTSTLLAAAVSKPWCRQLRFRPWRANESRSDSAYSSSTSLQRALALAMIDSAFSLLNVEGFRVQPSARRGVLALCGGEAPTSKKCCSSMYSEGRGC